MSKPIHYKVITKIESTRKIEGLVCSQWIETKRITGSFWIGSYDTEYFHTTVELDSKECWDMKLQLKCGENRNVANGKTYSFKQKPIGEGKWMAIKEYSVKNCLAQKIDLKQEYNGRPLLSPFGSHNVSLKNEKIVVNHSTIVWHKPNEEYNELNCKPKTQFVCTGRISLITLKNKNRNSTSTGRLIDSEKQLDVLFNPTKVYVCGNIDHSYEIIGVPETHVVFHGDIEKLFAWKLAHKPRNRRNLRINENTTENAFAWGHLNSLSPFQSTEYDENMKTKIMY
jgi:hypothetical protein